MRTNYLTKKKNPSTQRQNKIWRKYCRCIILLETQLESENVYKYLIDMGCPFFVFSNLNENEFSHTILNVDTNQKM